MALFWNPNEQRWRVLWRILGTVLLIIILSLISGLPFALIGIRLDPAFQQLQLNLVIIVAIWLAARHLDKRKFSDTGLQLCRSWWIDLGFGLILGALLMAIIFMIEYGMGWLQIRELFHVGNVQQPFRMAILLPILFYIIVGFTEELLFRGYLLQNLAEGFNIRFLGPLGALILSWFLTSALFGVAHAIRPHTTLLSSVNITLAGLWIGLGYLLTGSLAIPIGIHITWNFFQGHVFGFPVSGTNPFSTTLIAIEQGGPEIWTGGAFGPEGGLLGLFAILTGALLVILWARIRYGKLVFFDTIAEPPSSLR